MKQILSFIFLIITANSFAQQIIVKENKDTLILTTVKRTISYDTIIQTLKPYKPPASNLPPIARAGIDFTVTIPASQTTINTQLNGSGSTDPEGQILKFFWRKISGPNCTLIDTTKPICLVSGLTEGTYIFELRAVDPSNLFSADNITVTVKKEVGATPIPFSFTAIPFSDPDLNAPGRGVEQWHGSNLINVPTEGINTQRLDVYYRSPLTWAKIETARDVYNWQPVINILNNAIARKQKVTLGMMSVYHDHEDGVISYDGFMSAYPLYLHQLMQSEQVKDWNNGVGWVPNYNSQHYLSRLRSLNGSLNNLLETGSFNGVRYKDIINSIDVRGYGNYGEWHNGGLVDQVFQIPSGAHATTSTLKSIIDAHTQAFPNFQLSIIMTAFDANWLQHTRTSPEVAYYALTTSNAYGKLGWRRDNWGATDSYISDLLENNTRTWNGVQLNSLIMNVWKYAPITGEPMNTAPNDYGDMERQVRLYHATSFGNGNIFNTITTALKNNIRVASKACGYRIISAGGEFTVGANSITITNRWQNTGITPIYDNWDIVYELVNSSGVVTTLGTSTFKLRLFQPSNTSTTHTETFTLNIPSGNYTLRMVVKDPTNYRNPLTLAIQGRNSDGSYNIKSFQR